MVSEERILRLREVRERTGLARSSLYQQIAQGKFPRQIRLGLRSAGWLESEVNAWIAERIRVSRPSVGRGDGNRTAALGRAVAPLTLPGPSSRSADEAV
ncbi:MAG: AlpA family transcriptional regulator [bacterium]